jgi:hypothetical protein
LTKPLSIASPAAHELLRYVFLPRKQSMDLIKIITQKVNELEGHDAQNGIRSAVRHINVAEEWFSRGVSQQYEDFFNDVVYRCNQAFEGMLKEAYQVLESEDASDMSPYEIETHLQENDVFTTRVVELFQNYRQKWRNPSTHNHGLLFSEQEALLSIVRVSAFTVVLLDQILEKISAKQEKESLQPRLELIKNRVSKTVDDALYKRTINLLELFIEETEDLEKMREVELIGKIVGFLESIDTNLKIQRNSRIDGTNYTPDLLVSREQEELILEVSLYSRSRKEIENRMKTQLKTYLEASEIDHGLLFIPPRKKTKLHVESTSENYKDRVLQIHYITPK